MAGSHHFLHLPRPHLFQANLAPGFPRSLRAALCRQCGGDSRLLHVDVRNGRDADARWLDDVDGVDANA
jgi:hypothetical protein